MNRNDDVKEQLPKNGTNLEEVTQLCHEYSSERENFHKLGFQCLLKKLKEIEKIILAISKMTGNDTLQIAENNLSGSNNDAANTANSSSHLYSPSKDIHLPNDLTFHSKQVLHKIFEKFETNINDISDKLKTKFHVILNESYCEMEVTINRLSQEQKTEAKNLIEALLSADMECFDENVPQRERIIVNRQPRLSSGVDKLQLPEDLNLFTKSVLNDIFENYESNVNKFTDRISSQIYELLKALYGQFDLQLNSLAEKQRSQLRHDVERVFINQDEPRSKETDRVAVQEKATSAECGFDTQLAHRFQELSRLVGAILDKNDNTNVTIDENHVAVIPEDQNYVNNNPRDQSDDLVEVDEDNLDETEYMGIPKLKLRKRRFIRQR